MAKYNAIRPPPIAPPLSVLSPEQYTFYLKKAVIAVGHSVLLLSEHRRYSKHPAAICVASGLIEIVSMLDNALSYIPYPKLRVRYVRSAMKSIEEVLSHGTALGYYDLSETLQNGVDTRVGEAKKLLAACFINDRTYLKEKRSHYDESHPRIPILYRR